MSSATFCLGLAIYFEGRGETLLGQNLIANTIENRVNSKHYPNNYCDVMTENKQFSFYNNVKDINSLKTTNHKALNSAIKVAENYVKNKTIYHNACHYTTHAINNKWTKNLKVVIEEGGHKFMEGGC